MSVEVKTSELNPKVNVVELSGRLDMEAADADTPALQQALDQSLAGVVIDMGAVHFISSSGLRMLIATYQSAQDTGKPMALVRAQPSVYKIFKVSALDAMFRFFDNEAAAIETLWQ
jgi:anti-sigma B factor antagonist